MTDIERIYVGGFEAGRLSGAEIVSRLRSQLADAIEIQGSVHYGSCFCHLNVSSKKEGVSALDSIVKLYHNVKWKGCKLKVEKARPHFLERLEEERKERHNRRLQEQLPIAPPPESEQPLPRYLKIKQKYGQECWKIDTRPVEVTDWKRFEKLRRKLTKPSQTNQNSSSSADKKSKPAIHMVFASQESHVEHKRVMEPTEEVTSESDSESTTSEPLAGPSKYQWSDDESISSSTSSEDQPNLKRQVSYKEPNLLDEFDAAVDTSSIVSDESDGTAMSTNDVVDGTDLANEVERGLNVLSQLFPEVDTTIHPITEAEKETSGFPGHALTSNVMMERFDPTLSSAEHYILDTGVMEQQDEAQSEKSPEKASHDDDNASSRLSASSGPSAVNDQEPLSHSEEVAGVYQEKKLEEVFREARDPVAPVALEQSEATDEAPGGFSFGFHVDSSELESQPQTETFTFQFSFKDDNGVKADDQDPLLPEDALDVSKQEDVSEETTVKRRRTLFTEEELSSHVEEFYLMGDGPKIRDDLARYRADEQIHRQWLEERKFLTQDWKRKRKAALSKLKNRKM